MSNPEFQNLEPEIIPVLNSSDAIVAKRKANAFAASIGFNYNSSNEIALVVSELATNLIKHANQGMLTLSQISEGKRSGIQIISVNGGEGITNVEEVLKDGFSTSGSLGYGLGAVNRSMDEFEIKSNDGFVEGVKIVCKRWKPIKTEAILPCPLDVGAAIRKHPRMKVNGDTFVIRRWEDSLLVGVIDGLGHGQFAHKASQQARYYIESHSTQDLGDIFRNVQRSCRGTRGVVMALARFDFESKAVDQGNEETQIKVAGSSGKKVKNPETAIHLKFASIGNIEARVLTNHKAFKFIVRRGIVGRNAPNPTVTDHEWNLDNIMVLHSDGLSTRWGWNDFPHYFDKSASVVAQKMVQKLAKDNDDAVVVVIKSKNGKAPNLRN